MSITFRWLVASDLDAYYENLRRQIATNGEGGRWFTIHPPAAAATRFSDERLAEVRVAHARALDEPGWIRVLGAWDGDRLVGHADLRGGAHVSDLHRCTLGLGLQLGYRGQGVGRRLMDEVIGWARGAGLAWMDLAVFDGNAPALALYRALGFVEVGRVHDRYRVEGASLTDIAMTLALTQGG